MSQYFFRGTLPIYLCSQCLNIMASVYCCAVLGRVEPHSVLGENSLGFKSDIWDSKACASDMMSRNPAFFDFNTCPEAKSRLLHKMFSLWRQFAIKLPSKNLLFWDPISMISYQNQFCSKSCLYFSPGQTISLHIQYWMYRSYPLKSVRVTFPSTELNLSNTQSRGHLYLIWMIRKIFSYQKGKNNATKYFYLGGRNWQLCGQHNVALSVTAPKTRNRNS